MTALPVAQYLAELSSEPSRRSSGRAAAGSDTDALIKEAHARGLAEGRASIQQEHKSSVLALTQSFQQKVQAERARWAGEQGTHLAQLIATHLDDIERRVAEAVGGILRPIVEEQIRVHAVAELTQILADMLSKGDYAKVTVSGPQDLIESIESGLGGAKPAVSFVTSENADLTVTADETILETRIGVWAEVMRGAAS
ncbi:MAG: hypothetical protein AB7S70_10045 [Hyphomicrobium sp.]|uniref:hypothetical protein n=1 Tax=Hyphomicrobium sp. TaxID=82 RepID=UPI003D0E8AFE